VRRIKCPQSLRQGTNESLDRREGEVFKECTKKKEKGIQRGSHEDLKKIQSAAFQKRRRGGGRADHFLAEPDIRGGVQSRKKRFKRRTTKKES